MEESHASTDLQTYDETGKSWHMISTVCILQTPISKNVLTFLEINPSTRVYSEVLIIERKGVPMPELNNSTSSVGRAYLSFEAAR